MSRQPDVQRMGEAMRRPGIDSRTWIVQGTVQAFAVDPEHGVFAEVKFEPSGDVETCMVGAAYAGNGFGIYAPLEIGDVVAVAVPNGDPDAGCVVVARLWNTDDKPPAVAGSLAAPSPDFVLVAKPGVNVRINVAGAGDIVLDEGTLKTARVTDPVRVGTLAGTAPPGGGPVSFVFTPLNADGAPGVPDAPSPTANLRGVISNAGGAEHVKS